MYVQELLTQNLDDEECKFMPCNILISIGNIACVEQNWERVLKAYSMAYEQKDLPSLCHKIISILGHVPVPLAQSYWRYLAQIEAMRHKMARSAEHLEHLAEISEGREALEVYRSAYFIYLDEGNEGMVDKIKQKMEKIESALSGEMKDMMCFDDHE